LGRYKGPVCRQCRREGEKLFLKGKRCISPKCAMEEGRHPDPPGPKHFGRHQMSDYKVQLREKQKARRIYRIPENQFYNYYELVARKKGVTGDNLFKVLESRLDNVVYRLGFGSSRVHARQLVSHGHFTVNGKKVNLPSYLLKPGDVVQVKDNKRRKSPFKEMTVISNQECRYGWLTADYANLRGTLNHLPEMNELDHTVMPSLIVEFYSR